MKTRAVKRFIECERGTQMIEFAFLLPFLILLFAATVEMGRMFYTYTTLQKATEIGARYLSATQVQSDGTYLATQTTAAKNLVVCGRMDCTGQPAIANSLSSFSATNITVTPPGTATGTRYVTVSVTYAYQPGVFNLATLTGSQQLALNFTFTPSIRMRYMQ